MALNLVINGITYPFPQTGEEAWGDPTTNWAQAVTNGMLQKSGGLFTLTAELDFGSNFGVRSLYYRSRSSNAATTGQIRLSNTDVIAFRNAANSADLNFGAGSSNAVPQWNGVDLVNLSTAQTLTNKTQGSNLVPSAHNTLDLGSNSVRWKDGFFQGNVSIAGTLSAGSVTFSDITTINLTATGNTIIGDANTDTLAINADLVSNIVPDVTNTYDLGASANRWRDLYLSRDAYLSRGLFGNGTAALPSISFESDVDTGIFRPNANRLGISVRGVHRFTFEDGSTNGLAYMQFQPNTTESAIITQNSDQAFFELRSYFLGDSPSLKIYGPAHASRANDFDFFGTNTGTIIDYDHSDNEITFHKNSLFTQSVSIGGAVTDPLATVTLLDNTTGNVFTFPVASNKNFIVDYSIVRGAAKETGQLQITSDGTNVQVSPYSVTLSSPGVVFTADINSGNVRLRYTTTSTGSSATMKYVVKRWND